MAVAVTPAITPTIPPMAASRIDSPRNCVRIWLSVAPRARRRPISERRSSTEMIMMLATPTAPCYLPESCRLLESCGAGIERELTGGPVERVDRLVSEQLTTDPRQAGPLRYVLERDVARGHPPIAVRHEHGASDAGAEIVPPAVPESGVENGDRAGGPEDRHSIRLLLGGVSR